MLFYLGTMHLFIPSLSKQMSSDFLPHCLRPHVRPSFTYRIPLAPDNSSLTWPQSVVSPSLQVEKLSPREQWPLSFFGQEIGTASLVKMHWHLHLYHPESHCPPPPQQADLGCWAGSLWSLGQWDTCSAFVQSP